MFNLEFLARGNASFGANGCHSNCSSLEKVVFSEKVGSISANSDHFANCYTLKYANFPPIISASAGMFTYCRRLKQLKMGDIASISYGFVNDCRDLETIDFTQTKSVPSLSVSNAFSGLHPNYKILVSGQLYPLWKRATNWAQYADHIKPVGDYVFLEQGGKKILEFGEATTINLVYETSSGDRAENVTIVANNPNLVSITNKTVSEDMISFDVTALGTAGDVTITVSADLGGKRLTSETNISVFDVSALNYRVEDVDGATYGFEFNEDGW